MSLNLLPILLSPAVLYERVDVLATSAAVEREPKMPADLRNEDAEEFFRKKGYREIGRDGTRRLLLVSPDLYDPDRMKEALALRKLLAASLAKGKIIDAREDAATGMLLQRAIGDQYGMDVRGALVGVGSVNMLTLEAGGKTYTVGTGTSLTNEESATLATRPAQTGAATPKLGSGGSWFPPRIVGLTFLSFGPRATPHRRNEGFYRISEKLRALLAKYEDELTAADLALSRASAAAGLEDLPPNALVPGKNAIDLPEPERTKIREQFRGQFDSAEEADAAFGRAKIVRGERWISLTVGTLPPTGGGISQGLGTLIPR